MKKFVIAFISLSVCTTVFASTLFAHPGRTDSQGGHNCSASSKAKGLCSGYHYHNSGSSSSSTPAKSTSTSGGQAASSAAKKEAQQPAYAASSVKYFVNNTKVELNPGPITKGNSVYFPVRGVANSLDAEVSWNEKDSTITLARDKRTVVLSLKGDSVMVINGVTYAPIRLVAEELGAVVSFDSEQNAINIQIK